MFLWPTKTHRNFHKVQANLVCFLPKLRPKPSLIPQSIERQSASLALETWIRSTATIARRGLVCVAPWQTLNRKGATRAKTPKSSAAQIRLSPRAQCTRFALITLISVTQRCSRWTTRCMVQYWIKALRSRPRHCWTRRKIWGGSVPVSCSKVGRQKRRVRVCSMRIPTSPIIRSIKTNQSWLWKPWMKLPRRLWSMTRTGAASTFKARMAQYALINCLTKTATQATMCLSCRSQRCRMCRSGFTMASTRKTSQIAIISRSFSIQRARLTSSQSSYSSTPALSTWRSSTRPIATICSTAQSAQLTSKILTDTSSWCSVRQSLSTSTCCQSTSISQWPRKSTIVWSTSRSTRS